MGSMPFQSMSHKKYVFMPEFSRILEIIGSRPPFFVARRTVLYYNDHYIAIC